MMNGQKLIKTLLILPPLKISSGSTSANWIITHWFYQSIQRKIISLIFTTHNIFINLKSFPLLMRAVLHIQAIE